MSDKRDKPDEFDPDATVASPRGRPAPDEDATVMLRPVAPAGEQDKPAEFDPDATVATPRGRPAADEDATVMLRPVAPAEHDEDATVMLRPVVPEAPPKDEPAAVLPARTPLAAFQTEADPDATVVGAQAPMAPEPEPAPATPEPVVSRVPAGPTPPSAELATPVSADMSRMPMIAGGVVVLAVALYFAFGGGKSTAPVAPKAEVAAPAAPAPESKPDASVAPSPAAPAAVAPLAPVASAPVPAPAPAKATGLRDLLAADLKNGAIAITEEGGSTTITLRNTNQFASGGVDLEAKLQPIIARIAAALDKAPGAIIVTGHADAKPSSNPKFPSNQELSAARADSVTKLIAGKLGDPKRVKGEGASDSKPLAPSDTAENRAKNRRVVILLKPGS